MQIFEIILVSVIVITTLYFLFKGFAYALFGIAGIVLGVMIATRTYTALATILPITNPALARAISFILIFFIVAVLINLLSVVFRRILIFIKLGFVDKIVGGIFGFLLGCTISGVIAIGVGFTKPGKVLVENSRVAQFCIKELHTLAKFIAPTLKKKL